MKTPGVYFEELDAFGNAVVPVPTAVPAFIGYTLNTSYNGQDITFQPIKITSLNDFITIFGDTAPQVTFGLSPSMSGPDITKLIAKIATLNTAATAAINATGVTAAVKTALGPIITSIAAATTPVLCAAEIQKAYNQLLDVEAESPVVPLDLAAAIAVVNYANARNIYLTVYTNTAVSKYVTDLNTYNAAVTAGGATPTPAQQAAITTALTALNADAQTLANGLSSAGFYYNSVGYTLNATTINYRLYASIKLFFDNGGAYCYIYSIGSYDYTKSTISDTTDFQTVLNLLPKQTDITILVIPDAVEIKGSGTDLEHIYSNCYSLQNMMLDYCGNQRSAIAILDIPRGWNDSVVGENSVEVFRNQVNPSLPKFNSYGAAYYPWLNTTIYQSSDVSYANIVATTANAPTYAMIYSMLLTEYTDPNQGINNKMIPYINVFSTTASAITANPVLSAVTAAQADAVFSSQCKSYQLLINAILAEMNLLPPSAAMAGLYTTVDNNEGVWVAPANIGVQSVISPSMQIDDDMQEDLNVPIDGKSVCAIRAFNGRGTLVWGARTLDGNSNDWRYINVRRTMMYIEQSVKDAAFAYVFAPNVSSTWIDVQSMISNFLLGLWSQGGIAGTKPEDAFSVSVGLGSTMTSEDILLGIMRVAVKVAISHPAEFIDITFEQEMQQ